jgi:excisionase family DNA binding protein
MDQNDRLEAVVAATRSIMLPEVCFVRDLAEAFHCTEATVRSLIRKGEIPARRLGRRWVVERRALLRALTPDFVRFRLLSEEDHGTKI